MPIKVQVFGTQFICSYPLLSVWRSPLAIREFQLWSPLTRVLYPCWAFRWKVVNLSIGSKVRIQCDVQSLAKREFQLRSPSPSPPASLSSYPFGQVANLSIGSRAMSVSSITCSLVWHRQRSRRVKVLTVSPGIGWVVGWVGISLRDSRKVEIDGTDHHWLTTSKYRNLWVLVGKGPSTKRSVQTLTFPD